jgi:hypothetical protein
MQLFPKLHSNSCDYLYKLSLHGLLYKKISCMQPSLWSWRCAVTKWMMSLTRGLLSRTCNLEIVQSNGGSTMFLATPLILILCASTRITVDTLVGNSSS